MILKKVSSLLRGNGKFPSTKNYFFSFSFLIFECTIYACICTYVCEWMWKSEIHVQCLLQLFFCLFAYFWANYPCTCSNVCTWLWKPCSYLNSLTLDYFCVSHTCTCSHVYRKPEVSVQCLQLFLIPHLIFGKVSHWT